MYTGEAPATIERGQTLELPPSVPERLLAFFGAHEPTDRLTAPEIAAEIKVNSGQLWVVFRCSHTLHLFCSKRFIGQGSLGNTES